MGVSKALVIFPGALGDFVCLLPALAALREMGFARTVLACKRELAPLVRAGGGADVLPIEGREASWLFHAEPPHEAAELYGSFDRIDCFSGVGIAEVENNVRRWAGSGGRVHPFRPLAAQHLAAHFFERVAGVRRSADDLRVELALPAEALEHARRRVAGLGRPLLLVHPGSGGRRKRWSRSGFAEIVARATTEGGVAVVCGPAETGEADDWRAHAIPVFDSLDLLEVASLAAVADRYLGNDSGISHLAGAVGAHGVVLFGPTDPALWRPLSPRLKALRLEPWAELDANASRASLDRVWSALERP
jgi:heptosyltransferase-3